MHRMGNQLIQQELGLLRDKHRFFGNGRVGKRPRPHLNLFQPQRYDPAGNLQDSAEIFWSSRPNVEVGSSGTVKTRCILSRLALATFFCGFSGMILT